MILRHATILLLLASGCVDDASAGAEATAKTGGEKPPMPPAEALAACTSSAAGDSCAFDVDSHHVDGTCRNGPDGTGPLACAPAHLPPPPESLAACASSSAGASCAFDIDSHHVDGTCRNGPQGSGPLACAPAR